MKKIKLSLFGLMISATAFAQVYTDPANGNVGIGTTTPVFKLDVYGNLISRGSLNTSIAGNDIGGAININNPAKTGSGTASVWSIYNMSGGYGNSLQFWAYDNIGCAGGLCNNRFTLMDNGNVGIGITTPSEKLSVNGNIKLSERTNSYLIDYASLSETNGGASTILGNNIASGTTANSVKKTRSVADAGSFVSLSYYHGITFHTAITGELNIDQPVENSEKMRITQSGNVGIGTANPTEKLAVNGKIRAKEIKVEASNWPDYVFEEGYKVGTLEGLENYIKTNKHLPEVPGAKEVEANGVALGEMNKLLLKKIEELTLYVIELKKENVVQQKQLDQLQKTTK